MIPPENDLLPHRWSADPAVHEALVRCSSMKEPCAIAAPHGAVRHLATLRAIRLMHTSPWVPVFIASRASSPPRVSDHTIRKHPCIACDLSSRATEEELIQFVRAKARDADGPDLLGRQAGPPKASTFVLQEPLDLESWSWPIGMGRWSDPTPASHHPSVKPNALGLKLSA